MRTEVSEAFPSEDVTAVIRRFAAADAELIGRLHDLFREEMIHEAGRLFRRYRLGRAVYTELGMVNQALISLRQDASSGKLAWVATRDDFMRVFLRALRSQIAHAYASKLTGKRGQSGHEDVELDGLPSRVPDPARAVEAALDYEALAKQPRQPVLRVLELRFIGYSVRKIAAQLGMSSSAVVRAVKRIQSTWEEINHDPKRV